MSTPCLSQRDAAGETSLRVNIPVGMFSLARVLLVLVPLPLPLPLPLSRSACMTFDVGTRSESAFVFRNFLDLLFELQLTAPPLEWASSQPGRVSFKPGDLFSHSGALRNCCRVVVAHYDTETLVRGINILCDVIESEVAITKRNTPTEKDPTKQNAVFMG